MTREEFETLEKRYDELLERLVKGAEFLENPLIKPEVYEAGLRKYERLTIEFLTVKKQYLDHYLGEENHGQEG